MYFNDSRLIDTASRLSNMKFVVTGGAGFIGHHLVEYLIKKGHSVTVIDNLHTGKMSNLDKVRDKIDFLKLSILDFERLRTALRDADGVFHEAALVAVPESYTKTKEYFDVNVKGTENIFKLAVEFGFKIVYASSSSVYGNVPIIPIKEDFERKPINPYGETKLEDEFLAEKYWKAGVRIIGLRYFNVYGKGQTGAYAGVITKFMENIARHEPPLINGDGSQIRDFVFVGDVARANLMAMESHTDTAFINIGSGIGKSILSLANTFVRISGLGLEPIHKEALEGDVKTSQADITLAQKLLGWKPETKLEDWMSETRTII